MISIAFTVLLMVINIACIYVLAMPPVNQQDRGVRFATYLNLVVVIFNYLMLVLKLYTGSYHEIPHKYDTGPSVELRASVRQDAA